MTSGNFPTSPRGITAKAPPPDASQFTDKNFGFAYCHIVRSSFNFSIVPTFQHTLMRLESQAFLLGSMVSLFSCQLLTTKRTPTLIVYCHNIVLSSQVGHIHAGTSTLEQIYHYKSFVKKHKSQFPMNQ